MANLQKISRDSDMDFIEQYLSRSPEIIGNRTRAEIRYDNEVIRWLRKGREIKKPLKSIKLEIPSCKVE
jgi:hypothetical protein